MRLRDNTVMKMLLATRSSNEFATSPSPRTKDGNGEINAPIFA